jgi:hypothetical protein
VAARELASECRESASCSKLYPNPEGWISSEADLTADKEEAPDIQYIAGEARLGKVQKVEEGEADICVECDFW